MNAPQQIAPDILCLAHTAKKIEWCDRAECTCAAKDMTFGRCCKVENEMDDPNMHAYGEDGPDDAEIGRQWRENSSLEKWFPLTAEHLEAKERENLHLAREAFLLAVGFVQASINRRYE